MPSLTPTRPILKSEPFQVCFVCLGNICRSPTAEGIFQHLVNQRGLANYFIIDSAGTAAYHVGELANSKSRMVAKERGVDLVTRARKFVAADLNLFDLILPMDRENHENILNLATSADQEKRVRLMRDFDPSPDSGEVPDPYYGGISGFNHVFEVLERSCAALLDQLEPHIKK